MRYTKEEANEAIQARLDGIWDNPQLIRLGALGNTEEDIERIKDLTEIDIDFL